MLQLKPIDLYQKTQKDSAPEHQAQVHTSRYQVALTFALAAMAGKPNVTNENLMGARIFIDTLLNLAEKPEVDRVPLPQKDLRTDSERMADIKTQQKKKSEKK